MARLSGVRYWRLDRRRGPVLCDVADLDAGDVALALARVGQTDVAFVFLSESAGGGRLKTLWSGEVKDGEDGHGGG